MIKKNEYELNEQATVEKLIEIGFRKIENGNRTILVYCRELIVDVDLYVEFDITNSTILKFDEDRSVSVIDDEIGQYFMPFYNNIKNSYTQKTIKRYNEVMNHLVNQGILKLKEKEEVKQLKKIK